MAVDRGEEAESVRRVVMATDVPFWRGSTGAEQRMLALSQFLARNPFELTIFYLAKVGPADQSAIDRLGLNVVFFESERPPESFIQRIQWYVDATRNQLEQWIRGGRSADKDPSPQPLTLADYRWPWALEQFRRLIRRVKPDIIICQYVTMAYLLEALSSAERKQVVCVLDTHDILHERGRQFSTAGFLHWLEIDEREEIEWWNRFDVVIAIQEQERALIELLTSRPEVVVAGHALDHLPHRTDRPRSQDDAIVVGYIGSQNYSNWHAVNRFLIEVWPDLISLSNPQVKVRIAGKICDWFQLLAGGGELMNRVELVGHVESLSDFYQQIDLAVNPVQFGTGLKIKNVEALAFGKPLVTTASGAVGMPPASLEACRIVENMDDMRSALIDICQHPSVLQDLTAAAERLGKSLFSSECVFAELREALLSFAQPSKR